MVLAYAALGSGAMEHFHNAQHATEDSRLLAAAHTARTPLKHAPQHDDSNCPFHLEMHLSMLAVGWVPLLICLLLLGAFISLHASRLNGHAPSLAIPCRGPPIR